MRLAEEIPLRWRLEEKEITVHFHRFLNYIMNMTPTHCTAIAIQSFILYLLKFQMKIGQKCLPSPDISLICFLFSLRLEEAQNKLASEEWTSRSLAFNKYINLCCPSEPSSANFKVSILQRILNCVKVLILPLEKLIYECNKFTFQCV